MDSITVGVRHRQDLGDLVSLMESIKRVGLLQPIVVSPEGVLICGRRRLEAVKQLGMRTLRVWVRTGLSDRLTSLLAERDENALAAAALTDRGGLGLPRAEADHGRGRGAASGRDPLRRR